MKELEINRKCWARAQKIWSTSIVRPITHTSCLLAKPCKKSFGLCDNCHSSQRYISFPWSGGPRSLNDQFSLSNVQHKIVCMLRQVLLNSRIGRINGRQLSKSMQNASSSHRLMQTSLPRVKKNNRITNPASEFVRVLMRRVTQPGTKRLIANWCCSRNSDNWIRDL